MAVKIFFSSEAENPFYLVTVAVAIVLKMCLHRQTTSGRCVNSIGEMF